MASICLVSLHAAGALRDAGSGHIGGAERQAALMARWLAGRGHNVSVVVWADRPNQAVEEIDGIRLIPTCLRKAGLPKLRFLWPGWTALNRALREADADVYVHNLPESTAGKVALWTRRRQRRFVCMIASELECTRGLDGLRGWQEKRLFAVGLQRADLIIAQTERQRQLLRQEWNLDAVVAPMPCRPPSFASREAHVGQSGPLLWVGRIDPIKRVELLLDVAADRPDWTVDLIGDVSLNTEYAARMRRRAETVSNVKLLGRLPFEAVWDHYRDSSMLLCTSSHEGFPNTFLEAMYFGLPIITTFDPDGIIERHGLGAHVENSEQMLAAIDRFKSDSAAYASTSRNCRAWFDQHHAADKALQTIEEHLCAASAA